MNLMPIPAFVLLATLGWPTGAMAAANKPDAAMLPPRLLTCTLRRIVNFDPDKDQKISDLVFEGNHVLKLYLPATPVRRTPPPEATDPPEPVDPRTRIAADPDGLTGGMPRRFDRVVDYWPERVEMTTMIRAPLVNLIVVEAIDAAHRTANMFMTRASDAVTYDEKHMYRGVCAITAGNGANLAR